MQDTLKIGEKSKAFVISMTATGSPLKLVFPLSEVFANDLHNFF